jgi:hypothetical protein
VDGPYRILWSNKPIAISEETEEGVDYFELATGDVPPGETKVTVSFKIPEAAYGTNYVQFLRKWRFESPYGFTFSVVPDIKVSPASSTPGGEATVKGSGFPANKDVELTFDGKDTKLEITSNGLGSFEADFAIPNTIAGKHEFKAAVKNMSLGGDITASLSIVPKISLEPELPSIGEEVTLCGCGFAAKSPVSVKYDETSVADSPTTDDSGNFSHKFTVPESPEDNHVITATDKAGNAATYGLPLEGEAPPSPSTITPGEKQNRFGTFGAQLVSFSWTDVSDPSGVTYVLEVDDNLSFFPLEPGMRKTGLTKPGCTMQLAPGTYYWRVKAVDGSGNESDWALSSYPFKVGLFSTWYLIIGGLVFVVIFVLIVRAFFRRVREYYK